MFYIMARVSGGFTGTRETILKDKEGVPMYFGDKEEAEKVARYWNEEMNKNKYSMASFRYWVEEE